MPDLDAIIERLNSARSDLFAVADLVPRGRWQHRPSPGKWSAAEVIAHLTQVETVITGKSAKLIQDDALPVPLWKRWHLPVQIVEFRLTRRQTPIPLDPALVAEKE